MAPIHVVILTAGIERIQQTTVSVISQKLYIFIADHLILGVLGIIIPRFVELRQSGQAILDCLFPLPGGLSSVDTHTRA